MTGVVMKKFSLIVSFSCATEGIIYVIFNVDEASFNKTECQYFRFVFLTSLT